MSDNLVLTPVDATNLTNQGLLRPGNAIGTHRIHKRRLNCLSDTEYREIPLEISFESPAADNAFALIPAAIISLETLIHVGFSVAKATEVWNRWNELPSTRPRREMVESHRGFSVDFIDYIVEILENQGNAISENDEEWRACLNRYGIDIATQDAIMDPTFSYFRLGESCLYWVKDTIQTRYAGLQSIQSASRDRTRELQRTAAEDVNAQQRGRTSRLNTHESLL